MDLVEVLGFLFMLSTMELGRVILVLESVYSANLYLGIFNRKFECHSECYA